MAWYKTGTIAIANGAAALVGTGTAFVENMQAGHGIILPDGRVYEVQSVNSGTSITLSTPYQGSTVTGGAFLALPTMGFAQTAAALLAQLITDYQAVVTGAGAGKFADGAVATPGIAFAADQDTGLRRPGSNQLNAVLGGSDVLLMAASASELRGNLMLGGQSTADQILRIGSGRTGNGYSLLDLQGDPANPSGLRLIRGNGGANAFSNLEHAGTGDFKLITASAAAIVIATNATTRWLFDSAGHLKPATDNASDIGSGSQRIRQYYGANTAISSSDARIKVDGAGVALSTLDNSGVAIDDGWLDAWGDVRWVRYHFAKAWEAEGEDARWHIGMVAQAVRDAFAARGLDATRIGLLCHDEWDDILEDVIEHNAVSVLIPIGEDSIEGEPLFRTETVQMPVITGQRVAIAAGDLWSLRYDQCFAVEAAWSRREHQRKDDALAALTARVAALEAA